MKILYLITGLGGGGAEKVVVDLADRMTDLGHEVKIAYLKGQVVVRPTSKTIELVGLGLDTLSHLFDTYQKYKALITTYHPDVVHAHMVHANIFARLTRKFLSIPKLICTAHSNNEGGKLRMMAYGITHSLADLTTNVSQSACESFERLGAVPMGGIHKIYNGIDLGRFQKNHNIKKLKENKFPSYSQCKIILAVGRLDEAKDYPNLISAFKDMLIQFQHDAQPMLLIAGEGHQRPQIESLISEYKLNANIKLLGRRDDIHELMSIADLFVLSSSFEGFGLVVAEAMACETFVVATDCGGVKEVMGGTGILVPPKNSRALSQALLNALALSKDEKIKNNQIALNYVINNFDLNVIVKKWIEIYES
ncbi:glycosyltransferase [Acinetobacter lanii]|uniref:Glycosyltransferase n=1 Tax=Acinetobacter lanii TaxID=2715163 RepID=A0A6G8S7L8_9GAMM|nr:glycosyltransferase [Acinetobacter lanii]QIO10185.1 glycosyltransferase [Acinetobacter lanii]